MFNSKIKDIIFGEQVVETVGFGASFKTRLNNGMIHKIAFLDKTVNKLEKENKKLKGIVAELCDYVYAEKK